jgi:hypothetical protein
MSEAPERIWAWWDDEYDVGVVSKHGAKGYVPDTCKGYVRADRIEELEKACAEWAEVSQSNYQRAKAAEAKLAKTVELVEEAYSEGFAEGYDGGWIGGDYRKPWKKSALFTTLAELKGQNDE